MSPDCLFIKKGAEVHSLFLSNAGVSYPENLPREMA